MSGELRICDIACSHFDCINLCCWQAGEWGLCFDVEEGDYCKLGYRRGGGGGTHLMDPAVVLDMIWKWAITILVAWNMIDLYRLRRKRE